MDDWLNKNDWDNEEYEDDVWDDNASDWDFDDDTVVTVQLAENEECPVCKSKHCIQNYGNRWLFLCLDCFHQFYNS